MLYLETKQVERILTASNPVPILFVIIICRLWATSQRYKSKETFDLMITAAANEIEFENEQDGLNIGRSTGGESTSKAPVSVID